LAWTATLLAIKQSMAPLVAQLPRRPKFADLNAALVNYYATGRDYMGKHNDHSMAGGSDPLILSLSLGCSRPMVFTHTNEKGNVTKVDLTNGSVIGMLGSRIQSLWKHSVPRDDHLQHDRWNVSLRFHLQKEQLVQAQNVLKVTKKPTEEKVLKLLNY
jgi:alkylated DNA repair dioxygenase AlkB